MADKNELLIRVSGDAKDFKEALDEAESKTEDLAETLATATKTSAIAFAALTAEAYFAISAFAEKEKVTNQLTQSLQQQGIYSAELLKAYQDQADALQELTGIDADAIGAGQAFAQSMLGQTQISDELTKSVADLSVAKGMDLKQAFEVAAKAVNGNAGALSKYGIEIELTRDKSENMRLVAEALSGAFGGQAEAANKVLGPVTALKHTFGDIQEEIGARLAPAFAAATKLLLGFLTFIKDSKPLLDFITSLGIAAAVVSGLGVVAGTAGLAFLKLKAALAAANVAITATSVAVKSLIGATGIGLLVVVLAEIYFSWTSIWPRMQGIFAAFVQVIAELGFALYKILDGALTFDVEKIKEGMAQAIGALSKGLDEYNTVVDQKLKERADAEAAAEQALVDKNNQDAAAREARERAQAARLEAIEKEKGQLRILEAERASQGLIALQREEIALLEAIEKEKNAKVIAALQERLGIVREMQEQERQIYAEQAATFQAQMLENNEAFQSLSVEQRQRFMEQNAEQLQSQILTEKTAREQAALEESKAQIDAHNTFLKNQQKFGAAYAAINKALHSEVYKGTQSAFGDLAQLQSSSNSTLKGIGKAAAVSNIAMKAAESAMNIYAGFSTIPIIGPGLGVAGAAAAIAFGAEQTTRVLAAADGGLLTGGIPGRDSVPVLGMPGELVVPTKNFDEVVNAVAANRAAGIDPGSSEGAGGAFAHLLLELKGDLAELVEMKILERQSLGISLLPGAV